MPCGISRQGEILLKSKLLSFLGTFLLVAISLIPGPTARATVSVSTEFTTITWDESAIYEPDVCGRYALNYTNSSQVLYARVWIANQYGDDLGRTLVTGPGAGTATVMVCKSKLTGGPYRIMVETHLGRGGSVVASGSWIFQPRTPKLVGIPKISGTAKVGKTLRVSVEKLDSGVVTRYRWLRNGKVIGGASKASYKIGKADKGRVLQVRVTATLPGHSSVTVVSAKTKKVK